MYSGQIVINTPGSVLRVPVSLGVVGVAMPQHFAFALDLNSYSDSIDENCGSTLSAEACELLTHQMAHRHRHTCNTLPYGQVLFLCISVSLSFSHTGTHVHSHTLPYGQTGNVNAPYGPPLVGTGAATSISSWTAFDARLGKYLDGSAFTEQYGYNAFLSVSLSLSLSLSLTPPLSLTLPSAGPGSMAGNGGSWLTDPDGVQDVLMSVGSESEDAFAIGSEVAEWNLQLMARRTQVSLCLWLCLSVSLSLSVSLIIVVIQVVLFVIRSAREANRDSNNGALRVVLCVRFCLSVALSLSLSLSLSRPRVNCTADSP